MIKGKALAGLKGGAMAAGCLERSRKLRLPSARTRLQARRSVRDWYLGLPDTWKQIFLAIVSNDLTIHGRAFRLDLVGEIRIRATA